MSGRDNIVTGNFVSGCEYGIRVACGEYISSALTPSYTPDVKPNGKKTAQVRIPTYPQVLRLTLAGNVTVGISGPDLEIGSSYKNHWPESQQVLLPEDCVIKNNRFIRNKGGEAVLVTVAETQAPLDRFTFKPNRYDANTLIGEGRIALPAQSGFIVQPASANDSKIAQAAAAPLSAEDVGPAWVIARRRAGELAGRGHPHGANGVSATKNKAAAWCERARCCKQRPARDAVPMLQRTRRALMWGCARPLSAPETGAPPRCMPPLAG
jgi:hypothetical protein